MSMWRRGWWSVLWVFGPLVAQAEVDLGALDRDMAGSRAQVLVLGTVHLAELGEGFDPAALAPLLDRLAAFQPDVITIEALSGQECDQAVRYESAYAADFCPDAKVAKAATGLDVPEATAQVRRILRDWPAAPTPAQRRRLAALMLAANDRASAYTQWLQLPEHERHAGDGLDASLVEQLARIATRRNENYLIGAQLAARMGLARVHAADDHTGDDIQISDEETFGRELRTAWERARTPASEAARERERALAGASDLLPLYRFINEPEHLQHLAETNVAVPMRTATDRRYPQIWVGGWETRNLRMVARIRESFRERPGARVLSIVGVSHKPWFDAWLGQLQGVQIVDVEGVLK